jgi:hypothetical protein
MSDNKYLLPLFLSCLSGSLLFPFSVQAQVYSSFEPENISQFSTIGKTFVSVHGGYEVNMV